MKVGSIYIIRNTVNDKVYIGQTTMTVHERFMVHMKPSTAKQKRNYKLYMAVLKYGRDKFYVETLESDVPLALLNQKEIEYIAKYNSYYDGYNSSKGGDGRIINKIENEDLVLKMAKDGVDSHTIAEKLNVNYITVLRTLHKLGFYYHPNQEKMVRLSASGMSNKEIAQHFECHPDTVSRALDRHNVRKHRKPVKCRSNFDIDAFIKAYNDQIPIEELCSQFGLTKTTFYRLKKQYNIPTRPQIYKHKIRYYAN